MKEGEKNGRGFLIGAALGLLGGCLLWHFLKSDQCHQLRQNAARVTTQVSRDAGEMIAHAGEELAGKMR